MAHINPSISSDWGERRGAKYAFADETYGLLVPDTSLA